MANSTENLILPKGTFRKKGIVILPLVEYEKIREKMERLERGKRVSQEEVKTLKIIAEGEKEYKDGKLKRINSLAELK